MPEFEYIIPDYLDKKRVDKGITELCVDASRTQVQKAIRAGNFTIGGVVVIDISSKLKENDVVRLVIEEDAPQDIVPANIPLDIVYEDEHLMVINKSPTMTVHPGAGENRATLVNALLYHTNTLSDINGEIRPGIVHRLDKTTSGLMVVAKNNKAHVNLAAQIQSDELIRRYKAIVWGVVKPLEGRIDIAIGRSSMDRKKMTTVKKGGKHAVTHYKTIEIMQNGLFSLIECQLETGRTHQIRVHLSHTRHSIVGDQTYGNNARKIQGSPLHLQEDLRKMSHQALHSFYISFIHPVTGIRIEFEKDVPEDYNHLLEVIRKINK